MSTASEPRSALPRDRAPPPLVWQSWPMRDRWQYAVGLLVGGALVAIVSYVVSGHVLSSWIILAALLTASWRAWMPVTYELDARGIHQRVWRRRHLAWHVIAQYRIYDDGILVLRDAEETPLDPCRGLFFPWGRHRAEISALVQYYLQSSRSRRAGSNWRRMSTDFDLSQSKSTGNSRNADGPP